MQSPTPSTVALRNVPAPMSIASLRSTAAERTGWHVDTALYPLLDELSRIGGSATATQAATRFDVLLRGVGQALCGVLGVSRCSVYLTTDGSTFSGLVDSNGTGRYDALVRSSVVNIATDPITAELVRTRAPVVVADARVDAGPVAATVRRLGIRTLVAVPLVADGSVIGAAYLHDEKRAHHFPAHDIARATLLARSAAPIVRQGQVVVAMRRCLDNGRVERDVLARTARGQLSIDAAAIVGACPTQLVAHVGKTLNRPVLLLGSNHELLQVSDSDERFGRAVRDAWRAADYARHAATATSVLPPAPHIGLTSRQIVSPIAGAGALVALEVGRRFDDADRHVLDHAATVIQLNRDTARVASPERAPFGALSARAAVEEIGFPAVVVWLGPSRATTTHNGHDPRGALEARGVVLPRTSGTGIVLPATDTASVVATLATDPTHVAVVSRVARTTEELLGACSEVDTIARMLEHNGVSGGIIALEDIGPARLVLANGTTASVSRLVNEALTPLLPPEIAPNLSELLLDTARTLIASDGSVREAARHLQVHENTVRYRVRRIRELAALDVAVPADLFQLQVALCAWDLLGFKAEVPR